MNQKNLIVIVTVGIVFLALLFYSLSPRGENRSSSSESGGGVDLAQVMQSFSENMDMWHELSASDKVRAVSAVMQLYTQQNDVTFTKSPEFYAASIESAIASPRMRKLPLDNVIRVVAVMEYDFDKKGVSKDELAREILGEKLYEQNKARREAEAKKV